MSGLDVLFADCRAELRAALVGYLPAGYPTVDDSARLLSALIDSGVDLV
ncbi:MAG: tryptophan synthase alpha chain, partial [Pseudonocardiales bacterium]|nr:tryptophan synthase alpha chain [Pseudonocardiales bacterium]